MLTKYQCCYTGLSQSIRIHALCQRRLYSTATAESTSLTKNSPSQPTESHSSSDHNVRSPAASSPAEHDDSIATGTTAPRKSSQKTYPGIKRLVLDKDSQADVYVVTFRTGVNVHAHMTSLRRKYYPKPKHQMLPAHLTAFHALPGSKLKSHVIPALEQICAGTKVIRINTGEVKRHGNILMVGLTRGEKKLRDVRSQLQALWSAERMLTKQDSEPKSFHFTIMNKVSEQQLDEALAEITSKEISAARWTTVTGLDLFKYGPTWQFYKTFLFKHANAGEKKEKKSNTTDRPRETTLKGEDAGRMEAENGMKERHEKLATVQEESSEKSRNS